MAYLCLVRLVLPIRLSSKLFVPLNKTELLSCPGDYVRDPRLPDWHGWHSARRGLGSNLYRLGVPPMVIERILRHSNVSTTANYYIKTAADDVRNAMTMLEKMVPETTRQTVRDTFGTVEPAPGALPGAIN